jgi:hypothetical protein
MLHLQDKLQVLYICVHAAEAAALQAAPRGVHLAG